METHPIHSGHLGGHKEIFLIHVIWSHSLHIGQAFLIGQWRLCVKKHKWTTNADYNEGSSMLKRIFCNLTHSLSSEFMKCLMFWRPEPCFFHFWAPAWIRWIEGSPMTFHISAMNFKTRKGTNGGIPVVDSLSLSLSLSIAIRRFSCSVVAFTCVHRPDTPSFCIF